VSPSLSVGGRAIRHSLHSAIATFRSNNTSYPSRKKDKRTDENEQSLHVSKNHNNQIFAVQNPHPPSLALLRKWISTKFHHFWVPPQSTCRHVGLLPLRFFGRKFIQCCIKKSVAFWKVNFICLIREKKCRKCSVITSITSFHTHLCLCCMVYHWHVFCDSKVNISYFVKSNK